MVAETGLFKNWKDQIISSSGSTVSKQPDPYAGFSGTTTAGTTDPGAVGIYNLKPNERLELAKLLKSAGYRVSLTGKYNKGLADAYTAASQAAMLEGQRLGLLGYTVRDFLSQEAAARLAAGDTRPRPELSRSVYQYSPEQIDADINEVAQKVLGRTIVDADREADWYQDLTKGLNKMISKGTTTTTKLVKNKKTGKLEQVTTQTPKFTKEKAAQAIETAVSKADPISLERKQNLDFANWAFEKMGGRG